MNPKIITFVLFLGILFIAPISPQVETFCDQIANYTMDIDLDTRENMITGKELITWTNTSDIPCQELWFHLYWNAFQNNQSTYFREGSRRGFPTPDFRQEDWGYCRVNAIQIIENSTFAAFDLTPLMTFVQPDDDNTYDQTVMVVSLPQPVQPGEIIELAIDFQAKIPKPISRTGVYQQYYFIAQWFPKLGVFEDGFWNCHQYHAFSEYFADYGTYDVKISLPSTYVIGATGEHREEKDNGDGTTTHRFYQHSVHDFAWTASPDMLQFTEMYEFAPGKQTEITLLLQPYHLKLKERYLRAVREAVKYASLWFGDYPYSTITCVDPAYNSRSGGMEYPTFFTGGAYFLTGKGISRPEGVTIHEFGHGYFYGLLGSNEFEFPWMDEGMTSYLDTVIYYHAYGEPVYWTNFFGIPVTYPEVTIPIESAGISSHRLTWNQDEMQRFAWRFMRGESYGANSYAKGQLMMLTLRRYLGDELFGQMIKTYSTRWWWKHPQPEDFVATVSEFVGEDMSWFLDQFIFGSGSLDYAIGGIVNRSLPSPHGWFDEDYRQPGKEFSPSANIKSEVLVRRMGEVQVPVELSITFDNGRTIREIWDGMYRWKKFTYLGDARITRAVVDPEFKYVLDINRTNNSMCSSPNPVAPYKWASKWMIWLQHALEFLTFFGG